MAAWGNFLDNDNGAVIINQNTPLTNPDTKQPLAGQLFDVNFLAFGICINFADYCMGLLWLHGAQCPGRGFGISDLFHIFYIALYDVNCQKLITKCDIPKLAPKFHLTEFVW